MRGGVIAALIVGLLAIIAILLLLLQRKSRMGAAAAAAAPVQGEVVDYFEPDPSQPGVYAKLKAKMHEYAEASALVVQNATAAVDSDGYVVDDFNPNDLGRRVSINVGTRHAVYAIPVAADERAAVIANSTYGQPNAVVPVTGPALRSNKKKQGTVHLGVDQENKESTL